MLEVHHQIIVILQSGIRLEWKGRCERNAGGRQGMPAGIPYYSDGKLPSEVYRLTGATTPMVMQASCLHLLKSFGLISLTTPLKQSLPFTLLQGDEISR
jgi:hypothetical protein